MIVSFIIPHKGRLEMLKATIESILNLDYDQSSIEIIVVSQNDSLDTKELIEDDLKNQLTILLVSSEGTISKSRNIGAQNAKGEYLAFLDADIELSNNWLKAVYEEMAKDSQRKIVSAIQAESISTTPIEQIRTALNNINADSNVDTLAGANLFISKKDFNAFGCFPEKLKTCEDIYFTSNVAKSGLLYYTSKASHIHLGEDRSWGQLFNKEIWRGQSNLMSLRGRTIPIREYPSLLIPFWMFFFILLLFISIFSSSLHIFLSSILAILLPIVLYSCRLNGKFNGKLKFTNIFKFYAIYFLSRTIGTILGTLKSFKVKNSA